MLPSTTPAPQSVLLKWVNFGLGSLMIHLSGLWWLQNAPLRPVSVELRSDTIPVEYIDSLPPNVPSNPSPPAIPPQSSSSRPSASPRLNPSPMTAATPLATPQPSSQTAPQPSPVASPRVNPSPRTVASPPPSPSPVVQPTPIASPTPPPTPRVSPSPSPVVRPTPVASPSLPPPSPSPSPSPVVRPTPPPLSSSPAAPSQGVLATILGVQSGNGGRDEPTQLAQPQIQQQSFPSLVYPLGNQPTVLQVRLLIDAQGRPEVQGILQGSDRPEIRRFVEDLMQDWQFSPALSGGEPVYSFLDISVRITPSGS